MSTASKQASNQEAKEHKEWQERAYRSEALSKAVSLVRSEHSYDPKNIVKDAQVFYQFLKGATK